MSFEKLKEQLCKAVEDCRGTEARHISETAKLASKFIESLEAVKQKYAEDSSAMQSKHLSESKAHLQQTTALQTDIADSLQAQHIQHKCVSDVE